MRRGCSRSRLGNALRGAGSVVLALGAVGIVPAVADASSPPSIYGESVSHLTPTDATLEAQIDPREAAAGDHYQFQLVANPSEYSLEILCPTKLPPGWDGCEGTQSASALPIGFIPGNSLQPGTTLLAGVDLASAGVTLKPGTTYHYRVLAARRVQTEDTIAWEPPTVYGPDQTFTTPTEGSPLIEGESVSHLTPTDAVLEAQINTEGLESTYTFYLQKTEPPCLKAHPACEVPQYEPLALPAGNLLGSPIGQSVSADLNSVGVSLSPGQGYEYWVSATNAAGSTPGPAKEFTAPEDGHPQSTPPPSTAGGGASQPGPSSTQAGSGGSSSPSGVTPAGSLPVCLCDCARGCHAKKASAKRLSAARLDSGVRGRVLYGPTCPVQRVGQTCTRPYQATITVRREPTNGLIAHARSSSNGYFSVRLTPGRYLLTPQSGQPFPRSSPQTITVHSHRYTNVVITYDSGIR